MGLVILLAISQSVYCQDTLEIRLEDGKIRCNPLTTICTCTFTPFSVHLEPSQEFTVNLIIPRGLDLSDSYVKLSPGGENPADVTIILGATQFSSEGEFTEKEFRNELKNSMEEHVTTIGYELPFPIKITSTRKGTIVFTEFTLEYTVIPVEGLEALTDSETGMPKYFLWEHGMGSNPRYRLQIRSEEDFPSGRPLLEKADIASALYKLSEQDVTTLGSMEPGKTYSWGVKTNYSFGESPWAWSKFTLRPLPVSVDKKVTQGKVCFTWDPPPYVDHYEIAFNSSTREKDYRSTTYCIDLTTQGLKGLYAYGENILTIWTISGNVRSIPCEFRFDLAEDMISSPDILYPTCMETVRTKTFTFKWIGVQDAEKYELQLFDAIGSPVELPVEGGTNMLITVAEEEYNPWDSGDLQLRPGVYTWKVRALPKPGAPPVPSKWVTEMFLYEPVTLRMLILYAGVGGVVGGFIRITQEERARAQEKKRRMKIYLDYQTFADLLVGLIIGIIFYLLVNQTLSQQLNPLNIPPLSYAGSGILGFIGGILSYELTRVRRVIPERE